MRNRPSPRHHRRSPEDLVAALEAKIESIKASVQRKRTKANPAIRYTAASVRNMDKAMAATDDDAVLRRALEEAHGGVIAYLSVPHYLRRNNPGQRGEDIADAMGTDSKAIRLSMKKLIAEGTVRTKGERRAMRYYAE